MNRTIVLLIIIAASMIAATGLQAEGGEIRWYNPASSPLSFGTKPKTRIAGIENKSRAEIITYQLGCLTVQDQKLRVLSRYKVIEGSHFTPNRMGMMSYDTLQKEWRDCSAKAGSLSAVEVRFADGAIWQVPGQ